MKPADGSTICSLETSRTLAESVIATAPVLILVLDNEGKIVSFNPYMESLTGYRTEEVKGKDWFTGFLPDYERERINRVFKDSIDGQRVKGNVNSIVLRSGEERVIEWYDDYINTEDGTHIGLVAIGLDVTDRVQTQKQLDAKKQLIDALLRCRQIGIMVVHASTRKIVMVNTGVSEISEYAADEILGRQCHLFLCPAERGCCPVLDCQNSVDNSERILVGKNGNGIPILKTVTPFYLNGESHLLETFVDISERKKMEGMLLQSKKMESIGQMAAGVAHEINTPIQFINDNLHFIHSEMMDVIDFLGVLKNLIFESDDNDETDKLRVFKEKLEELDTEFLQEELPEAIEQSQKGAERVAEIVAGLKEFSHPGTADKILSDVNHCIENAVTISRNEWKAVADVELLLSSDIPPIRCFPGELSQALLNLVVNASHAIAEKMGDSEMKGRLTITSATKNDGVEICIQDNGVGISEENRLRVFDPFFTTKEVGKGSGQGTYISHSIIVEKHGGKIDFSTVFGQGTTFRIWLPNGM